MQIKKDEVKNSLLKAAEKEFLEKGFQGASIRRIVQQADTTIGNFYNYFESKEAVFTALVDEIYNGFVYIMSHHNDVIGADIDINNLDFHSMRRLIHQQIENILPSADISLLLLIEKSKGTKYENVKTELVEIMGKHFLIHIEETNPHYPYPEIGKVLALQLIEGALDILHTEKKHKQKAELLTELMMYTITGMTGILQGDKNDKN